MATRFVKSEHCPTCSSCDRWYSTIDGVWVCPHCSPRSDQPNPKETEPLLVERESKYGDYTELARITRVLRATLYTGPSWDGAMSVHQDALHMIVVKLARIVNGDPDHEDHWRDIAGYATLAADRCKK